ncbi:hypothetical protein ACSXAY_18625 (plasmid) [Clostridium perfringens]
MFKTVIGSLIILTLIIFLGEKIGYIEATLVNVAYAAGIKLIQD